MSCVSVQGWCSCRGSAACDSLKKSLSCALCPCRCTGLLCVGTMCVCCLFPCPCLCEMCVCVSPASSSSPSGAPASLLPFSSLDCDHSQLTPLLLWQPENSLEKGQLAPSGPAQSPGSTLCGAGAPSVGPVDPERPSQLGLPLSHLDTPRLPAGFAKGLRKGNERVISLSE